jgi:predicted transcriptional regulator
MRYEKLVTVRVSENVFKTVEELCRKTERTTGEFFREALKHYIHNEKRKVFNKKDNHIEIQN